MKRFVIELLALLSAGCLLVACADERYDLSDGINKDITLFEEEISVPIGSIGPITVESTLLKSSFGETFSEFITVADDGSLLLESDNDIYSVNVHRIESEQDDVSSAFTYEAGDQSTGVYGVAYLLGMIGLQCLEQHLDFYASNPLKVDVPVRTNLALTCYNEDYEPVFESSAAYSETLKKRSSSPYLVYSVDIPNDVRVVPEYIGFETLELDLPANPVSKIYDDTQSDIFKFFCRHSCKIGVSDNFSFPQEFTIEDAGLEIGKFNLSKCDFSIVLENTLPLSVKIDSVVVQKDTPERESDYNITVSAPVVIAGGSPGKPGITDLKLQIAAKEGTIPDIHGVKIGLEATSQTGCDGVPLAGTQGIFIQSSSAKISGGITIPLN